MAKLFLKFDAAVLKEITLTQDVVTIGRLPDNIMVVDNLAVSGHHAKVYWDQDHYVLEDNNSLNGTYLNNRRVAKAALKDGDVLLIGKHTVSFQAERHADAPRPTLPKMDATVVLDTKQAKEMAAAAGAGYEGSATTGPELPPRQDRLGLLQVIDGKTDQKSYALAGKMTVIGKSDLASIKLKGFFAPSMAALINKRDNKYFIAASEAKTKVKVNGEEIAGQKELSEGDLVEVSGVKLTFGYQE